MAETRIPITRKQYDLVDTVTAAVRQAQQHQQQVIDTLRAGAVEDTASATAWATEAKNGVYELVLQIPDAPKAAAPAAPKKRRGK